MDGINLKQQMEIDEGYTLDYLIPAFFILIIGSIVLYIDLIHDGYILENHGIFVTVVVYSFCGLLLTTGILLLLVKSGIQIDEKNNRVRVYKAISNFRIGNWVDITTLKSLTLEFTYNTIRLQSRGTDKTYTTRTFDLFIETQKGQLTLLHNFDKKNLAYRTIKELKRIKNVPFIDKSIKK